MVIIENEQDILPVGEDMISLIETVITECIKVQSFPQTVEVSVIITDDEGIREINNDQRGINKPTDVLSFPMLDFNAHSDDYSIVDDITNYNMDNDLIVLGDIVISLERANDQAHEYGHSLAREVGFLTAHSMFHLFGYDHEDEEQQKLMRKMEEKALKTLGLYREVEK